jgi:ABC-type antimicrobial peptide transport system permease subunit
MFELEKAIQAWRKQMAADPSLEPGYIAEIESHLRDKIDDLTARGRNQQEAFEEAVRALGEAGLIGSQFFKVYTPRRSGRPSWQAPRFVPGLAWNYFRTASRFLRRHKGFAVLNIAGLTVGMLSFLLIMTWVRNELSYDQFHEKKDSLFLVLTEDQGGSWSTTTYALPPALKDGYPEVEDFARVWPWHDSLVRYGDIRFNEHAITLTDPGFFRMFSFPFVRGNPDTALAEKNSIVLTEETVHRYFGDEDPLGKVLHLDSPGEDFTVTGVVRDVPPNSSIRFDMVGRVEWLGEERIARWREWVGPAYVQLRAGTAATPFNEKIKGIFQERLGPNWPPRPVLQPFSESHLNAEGRPGIIVQVVMFSATAVLILLLACVNFMNLSAVQSLQRAREVGLRKTVGASRAQVIRQFLGEALLLSFLSMAMALAAAPALLPAFSRLAGKSLTLFGDDPSGLIGLVVLAASATGLLAGSYPAFLLSAFKPADIFRRRTAAAPGGFRFRKALIVFQFAASLAIIIGSIVVSRQLRFIRGFDLGFDRGQVVTVENNPQILPRLDAFKQELAARPGILNVTFAGQRPLEVGQAVAVDWDGNPGSRPVSMGYTAVDYDFFETFEMKMAEGRAFSRDHIADEAESCVVNEAAAKMFGWENPIGRSIRWNHPAVDPASRNVRIIGVVKNFFDRSLRSEIRPFVFRMWRPWNQYIFIKIDRDRVSEALDAIRAVFEKFAPDYPYRYEFLDEAFDRQYAAETQQGRLFNAFSALSIFIASLGLFGMAAYAAERRTKEIGIRKVMGASVAGLVTLLTKEYLTLIGAAVLIAWPVGYYFMSKWLAGFVRRTALSPVYFLAAAVAMLVVVLVAAGARTLRAARANPADSLRYE